MLDSGCPWHTYLDKDGVRRPAHLLIECREFLRLNRALQERMGTEQPVAGAIAYNAPPPPPNPLLLGDGARKEAGAKLTREIILLRSPATAPEKRLLA
jgi:hypothetical protein